MNEAWLNPGVIYHIVRIGLSEMLCLISDPYGDHVTVTVVPDDGDPFDTSVLLADLRPATALEIYQHGEARLKTQPLGPGYGRNAHKTMWDLMTDRDREYWRSLCPTKEQR